MKHTDRLSFLAYRTQLIASSHIGKTLLVEHCGDETTLSLNGLSCGLLLSKIRKHQRFSYSENATHVSGTIMCADCHVLRLTELKKKPSTKAVAQH